MRKTSMPSYASQSQGSMTMIMVPQEEWQNLHDTLELIIELITRRNTDDLVNEWIESAVKSMSTAPTSMPSSEDTESEMAEAPKPRIY